MTIFALKFTQYPPSLPSPLSPTQTLFSLIVPLCLSDNMQINMLQSIYNQQIVISGVMYKDLSLQWQNENQDLLKMSEEIDQVQFQLEREQRCLPTEFKLVSFMTQTQHHVNKLYKNPEQFPYNRNAAFMTFEPSRVALGLEQEKDKIQNYVNANFIQIEDRRSIATQGPVTISCNNFWRMVQQYNVSSIFMLCNLMQKGKLKCDRYYPQEGTTSKQQDYEIKFLEIKPNAFPSSLRIKKLELKNKNTGVTKIVTHYHVLDWPDGDLPQVKGQKCLRNLVNIFLDKLAEGDTPIVHCSAGVGRTGTFIAMTILRQLIKSNKSISIFNEVRKIREQRWGMVHTLSQYEFLYQFCQKQIQKMTNGVSALISQSQNELEQTDETEQTKQI